MPFSIWPYRRFPVCCPVTYHAGPFHGQGTVWNLSCILVGGKMVRHIAMLSAVFVFTGCVGMMIDSAISKYEATADQVELGDSKEKVLAILAPTQEGVPKSARKNSDKYLKDGVKVEIYYMRSARQPDGLTTDDEFTPYTFNDGKLVGIGWQVLGGPKSQGQATSDTYIQNTNTTIVH